MSEHTSALADHKVVSREDWLVARKAHLLKEKELTRLRDELNAARRELPWVKVEKEYRFETPQGRRTLAELFGSNSQLIVYHFMLGPGWKEGCDGCSFLADHFDGPNLHIAHHDVTMMAVSRAPLPEIQAFKKRMGWHFPWASSFGSDFNFDFSASYRKEDLAKDKVFYNFDWINPAGEELPGISVFYKDETGDVYHTYSAYARGLDILIGAHHLLDLTPKGRNESSTMNWVRHHDRYETVEDEKPACCSESHQ